jgi:nitrogen regulatory protein PII
MSDRARILIITIVKKGLGDTVIESSIKAGAEGATIVYGRGTGIHERKKIMGVSLEPEKEIVLSVVYRDQVDEIIKEITDSIDLEKPGAGIAFTLPLERVFGISHGLLAEVELETDEENDSESSGEESEKSDDVKTDETSDNKE